MEFGPLFQIGKVVGKKWKGPSIKKLGNPVEYKVKFDFNEGDHFRSRSHLEFILTEVRARCHRGTSRG